MSKQIDDGGPAYPFIGTMPATGVGNPVPTNVFHVGMSLRDWLAGQAMAGYRANRDYNENSPDDIALYAYQDADAMLAARDKESPNDQP